MTKMEFYTKKSQFRVKSQFKETKCADACYLLNWDFPVYGFNGVSIKWVC